ncbi:hypothetical protein M3194_14050 [Paenibacillus glycanilyticus]|uniref:hypothetical protein n=1 Tax=Paenibacillus glycanilyticus TaxID=126569 RepID=UPI002042277D|nr:hypothetical protein [Paenibacillus glycanilyticus]MCM3628484.1 hypothetical protein [Paenibacillus glycanilyticus]
MSVHQENYEERHIEKRQEPSRVASTFIKYLAYVIITFGVLYFVAKYILPIF